MIDQDIGSEEVEEMNEIFNRKINVRQIVVQWLVGKEGYIEIISIYSY